MIQITDVVVRALRRAQPYRPPKPDVIYVTEVVQPCMRRAYFERLHPRPPSVSTAVSEYLHSLLEEELKELGFRTEVGVSKDLGDFKLVGRVDAIMEDDEGNIQDVIEIKTISKLPTEPYPTHVKQLQVYMCLLEAPHGQLLYIDRNKGKTATHPVQPSPTALEEATRNAQILREALNNYVPPPKREGAWCVFCPFRRECRLTDWESRRMTA